MLINNDTYLTVRLVAGYFVVGITLVYALSGIFLHHKMGVKTIKETIQLSAGLSVDSLKLAWTANSSQKPMTYLEERPEQIVFYFPGGMGEYKKSSGIANYEIYKDRPVVLFLSRLHENQIKGWGIVADIYAVELIFLAISGLFMVPGKNGFVRRGVWWFLAGILLVVIFSFL